MAKVNYLQTNGKLSGSSIYTYAFNLPAVSTCPGAGVCKDYCFAAGEQKRYPSAMAYRQRSLELSRSPEFVATILAELDALTALHTKRGTAFAVRIHASGDFYSPGYALAWMEIISQCPEIRFYAYTKSVAMFKLIQKTRALPSNFTLIYSIGSNQDGLINVDSDRHARIFRSEEEALAAGYTLASEDDTAAWISTNNKIGLVIFGATKKFSKLTAA